jgi:hypothetical protein
MKTSRVTDFDPDAKAPTLKSSLDHMPTIEKPKPPVQEAPIREVSAQPGPRPVRGTGRGTPYPSTGSPIRNYARVSKSAYTVLESREVSIAKRSDTVSNS